MIKPITKPIILKYEDRMIKMPVEIEENIKKFWSEAIIENPKLFNGENHSVESVDENEDTTSIPKCLQIPGGGTSDEDIRDGELDISFNLKRELKEELNLNLDDIQYEMKYLECPTEKRSVYGFIATGKLDMSKEELNIYFENYKKYLKENNLEIEFSRLIFLNKSIAAQE